MSISYPMRASTHTTHPRDLTVQLHRSEASPRHDVTIWFDASARESFVARVLDADRRRAAAFVGMLRGEYGPIPDVAVLNLTSIDRLSHVYWQELDVASPVPEGDQAVLAAYELVDAILGEIIKDLGSQDQLLAFSEIGFGPLAHYVPVNDALEKADLLRRDVTGNIDWSRTVAFESVQGTSGVNLNDRERYKEGTVTASDRAAVRSDVLAVLDEFINPYTGTPFAAEVHAREDVYRAGPGRVGAADIILDPADWRYLPLGAAEWASITNRHRQSGWHRRDSYWAALGHSFTAGKGAPGELCQVAATIAEHFGRQLVNAAPPLEMA